MPEPAPTRDEMIRCLRTTEPEALRPLFRDALALKHELLGRKVHFRGIVEFSNVCAKNCYYCGIRRDNTAVDRFQMTEEEILECVRWAKDAGYGSVVLQSGERGDAAYVAFVEGTVARIKRETGMGITLSLGEQSADTYRRWFESGAHRYLLRIETSNPGLYAQLHPEDHSFERRAECLRTLRAIGYQVGTGVMIGLPGQTEEHLADDILFYESMDVDMIGMGPYVVHRQTPLASAADGFDAGRQLHRALTMIALTRLRLRDVNIASTTALQALHPRGREMGLQAGANIIMPNLTHTRYRSRYQLYDGKPCLDENATACRSCLEGRISAIGETIGYDEYGDSLHFARRTSAGAPGSDRT